MSLILLVRHGQANFGATDYDRLSELGRRQARVLGEFLRDRGPKPDRVVTGSMARHLGTAEACLDALGIEVEPEVDPRWDEYDHHDIVVRHKPAYRSRAVMGLDLARTGRPRRAFQQMFDVALAHWVEADASEAGYTETWPAFTLRVRDALDDLADHLPPSQTALVFTSGGPISSVAATLLGSERPDPALWLNLNRVAVNTGVTKLVTGRRGVSLISYNDHSHLNDELRSYR